MVHCYIRKNNQNLNEMSKCNWFLLRCVKHVMTQVPLLFLTHCADYNLESYAIVLSSLRLNFKCCSLKWKRENIWFNSCFEVDF